VRAANEASARYSNLISGFPTQPSIQSRMQWEHRQHGAQCVDAAPIVGQALDVSVAVPVKWSVVPILAGDGQGLGVFRVSGSARVGSARRAWSVVLKGLLGTLGSPTRWNYPAREALAYERGLARGPAARCRGAVVLWSRGARRPALPVA
jgi:hypothetical protein